MQMRKQLETLMNTISENQMYSMRFNVKEENCFKIITHGQKNHIDMENQGLTSFALTCKLFYDMVNTD